MGAKLPVRFNLLLAVSTFLDELMPCLMPLPEQVFLLRLARLRRRLLFGSHLCTPSRLTKRPVFYPLQDKDELQSHFWS